MPKSVAEAIGSLTLALIVILMLAGGMFVDEIVMAARMLTGGWDGIRSNAPDQSEEVICGPDGCNPAP
ncbi:MAG: hypothetical protein F6K00_19495 [Leptolyngbya sp. SIOISBB]|nr:hypothetical protein [Leptolyngbya sp. SIOISBB]